MSKVETHIGKLKRVDLLGKTQEEYATEQMVDKGERPSYHKTNLNWFLEYMDDEEDEQYYAGVHSLWKTVEHKELDADDDINDLKENQDGTISFTTRFYNGGGCLSEMLETGLRKIGK